jgi:hypothetical protein
VIVSSLQDFLPKLYVHLSSLSCELHFLPISFDLSIVIIFKWEWNLWSFPVWFSLLLYHPF